MREMVEIMIRGFVATILGFLFNPIFSLIVVWVFLCWDRLAKFGLWVPWAVAFGTLIISTFLSRFAKNLEKEMD